MLSKEFLKEAPGINPATGDPYTPAERDAEYEKNKAQGAKNLQGIKDFGSKISQGVQNFFKPAAPAPAAAAPAAPAPNPEAELDPAIMRARYDQEAAARKAAPADAAPPPPGGEVRPVPSSTIQATELPAQKSFSEPAPAPAAGAAPAPMRGGYGSGMNNPSVAPKTTAAVPADDGPEQLGYSPDELEKLQKNAGLPKTVRARNTETGEEYDKLATDDGPEQLGSSPDELERMQKNAGLATAQSAAVDTAPVPASANASSSYTGTPAATTATAAAVDTAPVPDSANASSSYTGTPATAVAAAPEAPAAATMKSFSEPAAVAPAPAAPESNPEAELDPAIMKSRFDQEAAARAKPPAATPLPVRPGQQTSGTFGQQFKSARDQGLKTFSYQGKSYSTAMKGAAPATTAAKPAAPATTAAKPAAPATTAAKPAAAAAKPAPQTGAAGQAARAASGKAPTQVAARQSQSAVMESQEISRMRFLAGLSKD